MQAPAPVTDLSDEDLIRYCESHSVTEVATFSRSQVNRMIALAGYPDTFVREVPDVHNFIRLQEPMQQLCLLARVRLAQAMEASCREQPAARPRIR